ncbi:DUF188 domain-containing protein [Siccirubricoccus deserti]
MVLVPEGADAADDWIAERITRGDVCLTADIPLASRCLAKGARALGFKEGPGRRTISAVRWPAAPWRRSCGSGVNTGGPAPLTKEDRSRFLAALDAAVAAARRDLAAPPPRAWVAFE